MNVVMNVKLKKVGRSEHKANSVKDVVEREKELNRRLLEADMDSWYSALSEYTYPTVFLPLSVVEAEAMIRKYTQQSRSFFEY